MRMMLHSYSACMREVLVMFFYSNIYRFFFYQFRFWLFLYRNLNYAVLITGIVILNVLKHIIIIIIIIIVWLVLEWMLLFPRATSIQKACSWKTLQLRCPR